MGRSSRSWSGGRAKSLVAAAVGALAVAAVVARRRGGSQPVQPGPVADVSPAPGPKPVADEPAPDRHPAPDEVPTFLVTEPVDIRPIPSPEVPDHRRPHRRAAVAMGLALLGIVAAFALAADRLVSAGSFAYAGTTSAIDVSHVRPGLWLAVDLTVEGEVSTTGSRLHEVAVDATGQAVETVTDGPTVWGRQAATPAALGDALYLPITEDSGEDAAAKGIALLPTWLRSTVDRHDAGTDALGRRLLRATLPADVLGEVVDGRPAADADVALTLDAAGDPVHVEVVSVPTGPPLRLALDLSRIGEAVTIDLP